MDLAHEKRFHFRDGSSASTLHSLKGKIEQMGYQEFYHHVNTDKNDFANWVRNVLQNEQLADDLQQVTSIVETVEIINDFLTPRPSSATRTDMQSRIEDQVLPIPPPVETPAAVEFSPQQSQPQESQRLQQLEQIEEKAGIAPEAANTESTVDEKVQQELFGAAPQETPVPPVCAPTHSDPDMTRIIVKDFIVGLLFGLVIGFIVAQLIP